MIVVGALMMNSELAAPLEGRRGGGRKLCLSVALPTLDNPKLLIREQSSGHRP